MTATEQVRAALPQDWHEDATDAGSIFTLDMGPEGAPSGYQVTVCTGTFAEHAVRIEAATDGTPDADAWIDCDDVARVARLAEHCLRASTFTREECNGWYAANIGYRPDDESEPMYASTEEFRHGIVSHILMAARTSAEQDERIAPADDASPFVEFTPHAGPTRMALLAALDALPDSFNAAHRAALVALLDQQGCEHIEQGQRDGMLTSLCDVLIYG